MAEHDVHTPRIFRPTRHVHMTLHKPNRLVQKHSRPPRAETWVITYHNTNYNANKHGPHDLLLTPQYTIHRCEPVPTRTPNTTQAHPPHKLRRNSTMHATPRQKPGPYGPPRFSFKCDIQTPVLDTKSCVHNPQEMTHSLDYHTSAT
jgi:hypothetical protein